jgi:hypothetical protein
MRRWTRGTEESVKFVQSTVDLSVVGLVIALGLGTPLCRWGLSPDLTQRAAACHSSLSWRRRDLGDVGPGRVPASDLLPVGHSDPRTSRAGRSRAAHRALSNHDRGAVETRLARVGHGSRPVHRPLSWARDPRRCVPLRSWPSLHGLTDDSPPTRLRREHARAIEDAEARRADVQQPLATETVRPLTPEAARVFRSVRLRIPSETGRVGPNVLLLALTDLTST